MSKKIDFSQSLLERKAIHEGRAEEVTRTAREILSDSNLTLDAPLAIAVNKIVRSPFQPRLEFAEHELLELANNIKETGRIRQPIEVRALPDGRYELLDGERRLQTAERLLEWTEIDAFVYTLDDQTAAKYVCLANLGRVQLSDFERARSILVLKEQGLATSNRRAAQLMGVDEKAVRLMLKYFELPKPILDELELSPRLFSMSVLDELLLYLQAGYLDKVMEAVKLFRDGKLSSTKILSWVARRLDTKVIGRNVSTPIPVRSSSGAHLCDLVQTSRSLTIKYGKNIDRQKLRALVESFIQDQDDQLLEKKDH